MISQEESLSDVIALDLAAVDPTVVLQSIHEHRDYVTAISSPDEDKLLAWSDDGTAKLRDSQSGKQIANDYKHDNEVNGATFSADENRILTWSGDGTAKLWEVPWDLDFPYIIYVQMIESLTGTRFDPGTHKISGLRNSEWQRVLTLHKT